MDSAADFSFVDKTGRPLGERLQRILHALAPRLRNHFPALRDDVVVTEILEEAGRRIQDREEEIGPIEKLRGYAWVTVRHVATSRLRLAAMRLQQQTIAGEQGIAAISRLPAERANADAIERHVLYGEVLALLTEEEQKLCVWKKAGFSSRQIARHRGRSTEAIDTMFFRVKQKVRTALGLTNLSDSPTRQRHDVAPADDKAPGSHSIKTGRAHE